MSGAPSNHEYSAKVQTENLTGHIVRIKWTILQKITSMGPQSHDLELACAQGELYYKYWKETVRHVWQTGILLQKIWPCLEFGENWYMAVFPNNTCSVFLISIWGRLSVRVFPEEKLVPPFSSSRKIHDYKINQSPSNTILKRNFPKKIVIM